MVSLVQELIKTQRELRQVKEQLRAVNNRITRFFFLCFLLIFICFQMQSSENSTIPLFVQYNGFFNELCDIRQTITIKELLVRV